MRVKFYGNLEYLEEKNLEVSSFKGLLAGIEYVYGKEILENLYNEKYRYVLLDKDNLDKAVAFHPDLPDLELEEFTHIFIIPEISGNIDPITIAGIIGATASASLGSIAGVAVLPAILSVVVNTGISFALSAIAQALTPTPSFNGDPAQAQLKQSSLWNGPVNMSEQGGPVPIIVGNPFCGGTIIASSITTEQL
jgi:predicted phage tail protein